MTTSNFEITYQAIPEDEAFAPYWANYDAEAYLESAIEGKVGIFIDNKPLLRTFVDGHYINEPTLNSYMLALWFIDCMPYILKESNTLKTLNNETLLTWEYRHNIASIGNGNYWPDIALWNGRQPDTIDIYQTITLTRDDGYNFVGPDDRLHQHYTVDKELFINAINDFIDSVVEQCNKRGYNNSELEEFQNRNNPSN